MGTATRDYTIRAGNSGTVENGAGIVIFYEAGTPLAPVDLTGQAILFFVRAKPGAAVVISKSMADGITVDLVLAKIVIPITVAESRLMEAAGNLLIYDIERRPGDGSQRTILAGRMFIEAGANDD